MAASREERKARKLKNEGQRLKNLQRAAANEATPVKTASSNNAEREVRKKIIERELKITKTSTASLGKFDDKLKGETKEKHVKRKVRLSFFALFARRSLLTLLRPRSSTPTRSTPRQSAPRLSRSSPKSARRRPTSATRSRTTRLPPVSRTASSTSARRSSTLPVDVEPCRSRARGAVDVDAGGEGGEEEGASEGACNFFVFAIGSLWFPVEDVRRARRHSQGENELEGSSALRPL